MAESQETPQSQKQEILTPQINDQNEIKKIENKSSIVNRYQGLKSSIGDVQNRINTFLDTVRIDDQNLSDDKLVTLPELDQQIDQLNKKEGTTNAQYLLESQNIKINAKALGQEYSTASAGLEVKIDGLRDQINQIDNKLEIINNQPGLKKTFSSLKSFTLRTQKTDLEEQKINLENQKITIKAKEKELQRITKLVDEKRQKALSNEIKSGLQEIKSDCLKFVEEALKDKLFLGEMRENLIKKFIEPKVESLQKERGSKINKKNQREFLSVFRKSLDIDELSKDDRQEIKTKLDNFFTFEGGFWEIRDHKKDLLDGGADKKYISRLLRHGLVVDLDLKNIAEQLRLEGTGIEKRDVNVMISEVNSFKSHYVGSQEIIEPELAPIKAEEITGPYEFHHLFSWMRAAESSGILPRVFIDEFEKLDHNIYSLAMEESLTDTEGGFIDALSYYPNPDTVRNLVIIAATERDRYNICHANRKLTFLAEQSNWPQILDEAEKKYPELKKARPVLKKWNFTEQSQHPEIRNMADEFSLRILNDQDLDPKLRELAGEALSSSIMIRLLIDKGKLPENEGNFLKTDLEKLHVLGIPHKNRNLLVSDYWLDSATRTVCKELVLNKNLSDDKNLLSINKLKRLSYLAQEMLKTKSTDILSVLCSEEIIDVVENSRLTEEEAHLFTKALSKLSKEGITAIDPLNDLILGQGLFASRPEDKRSAIKIISEITERQADRIFESLSLPEAPLEINSDNWQVILSAFIGVNGPNIGLFHLRDENQAKINTIFQSQETKNFCLFNLNKNWQDYLSSENPQDMPLSLLMVPKLINYQGAGPLTQIGSLGNLINSVNDAFNKETTAERTKSEIFQGFKTMEERFLKEKWSNEDRTNFYNSSRDIIDIAPSIYSDYLNLFQEMSSTELKKFNKDILPLYRAKLILTEKVDGKDNKTHSMKNLAELRLDIRELTNSLRSTEKPFERQKIKLLNEITNLFTQKFGIIKIPENFTQEHIKSFTNVSRYLANIHDRTPNKEDTLGFYLSLMINDKWDDFRRGVDINPAEYLIPEKAGEINGFLEARKRNNPLTAEALGVEQDKMVEFYHLLQEESQKVAIGNIETIDIKLSNIILNLKELGDLDLYLEPLDKQRMKLVLDYGTKKVGSVVARMYQQMSDSQRQFEFSPEDLVIKQEIEKLAQANGFDLNSQTLKQNFQDGLKPFAMVVNLIEFIQESKAEVGISNLRELLQPTKEVINIFNRLGEEFKTTSGAQALSQDLDYLDNIINKKDDQLTIEEKETLTKYTGQIRTKIVELEGLFNQIKNKFGDMEQGHTSVHNDQLKDKLRQINQIINAQNSQQIITSTLTNNLNTIIENIRACLGCQTNECNNDTDLTFGDTNKFYLYSQSENVKDGSISDQIVFVEPIIRQDGGAEMAFVLDKIYGTNTPLVLQNQAETVIKKFQTIKQKIPNIKLSVLISDAATTSGGLSSEMLIQKLKEGKIKARWEQGIEVSIAESATGDHYTEFGGESRIAGKRRINGVVIDS